eukprot:356980-Chlamydomonas_euryale.AAC.1
MCCPTLPTLPTLPTPAIFSQHRTPQGPTMWQVMRGSCKDTDVPTVTVEFDFEWPETGRGNQKVGGSKTGGKWLEGVGRHPEGLEYVGQKVDAAVER